MRNVVALIVADGGHEGAPRENERAERRELEQQGRLSGARRCVNHDVGGMRLHGRHCQVDDVGGGGSGRGHGFFLCLATKAAKSSQTTTGVVAATGEGRAFMRSQATVRDRPSMGRSRSGGAKITW